MVSGHEKKLKIAVDLRSFNSTGIGRVAKGIATYVPMLLPQYSYIFILNPGQADGINYANVEKIYISARLFDLREHIWIGLLLRRRKDIGIMHSLHFNVPLYVPARIKLITNIYDLALDYFEEEFRTIFHKLYYRVFFARVLKRSELVIAQSDYTSQDLKRFYNYQGAFTIYPGFDVRSWISGCTNVKLIYDKYALPRRYLLYVGINKPRKNLKTLVSVYKKLLNKSPQLDVDMVIAGKMHGEYYDIATDIGEKGLNGRVHLLGFVPDRDLKGLYKEALVYVIPSLLESGFSSPALEAASLGTPVLANRTDMAGFGGDSLYYFDASDEDDCVQKLEELISKPELRKKLSDAGRSWSGEFSWSKYAKELDSIYQKLLSE